MAVQAVILGTAYVTQCLEGNHYYDDVGVDRAPLVYTEIHWSLHFERALTEAPGKGHKEQLAEDGWRVEVGGSGNLV